MVAVVAAVTAAVMVTVPSTLARLIPLEIP